MRVRLSPAARADLRAIYRDGVRLFGEQQARRYLLKLAEELRLIGDFPMAVRLRSEFSRPVRIHSVSAHIVIYDVESDEIVVSRIRHGREDWNPNV